MSQNFQLAAIMFTDIVGYTALMGSNEEEAMLLMNFPIVMITAQQGFVTDEALTQIA